MEFLMRMKFLYAAFLIVIQGTATAQSVDRDNSEGTGNRFEIYTTVRLTTDLFTLTAREREMIPHLIKAAEAMEDIFWLQAYGDKKALLSSITDPKMRRFAEINYGPWDRLASNEPFVPDVGPKPKGANFYPKDMTKEEFNAAVAKQPEHEKEFKSEYTLLQRGNHGELLIVPYHTAYAKQVQLASEQLRQAAALADDPGLQRYLELRAEALLTDRYRKSDYAWMEMKTNTIDVVIGPIETYEDQLFGYRAANEAYVLVKDNEWSKKLARFAAFLPELQQGLPVPEQYKQEKPGTDSDLNAYDVVYYAGDCNAGSKTIAINLPNDEEIQLKKGTRRLQLKNAMRAKFEKILLPIAGELIAKDQQKHITFDAFFSNTMFHEVAHGLGIKNTITKKGTVRAALQEEASWVEEGKADILGLYMETKLKDKGELGKMDIMDSYVTFLAGIFRSIRFGGTSAHGRANLVRFNFFKQMGAFSHDDATGAYRVDPAKMKIAVDTLSEKLLRLQGNGDYAGVKAFMDEMGTIDRQLQKDLAGLASSGIPVDIVFEQGVDVLGLR